MMQVMQYTRLGTSGLKVSRICLGCMSFGGGEKGGFAWTLGYEDSEPIIKKAIDLGINFLDTANMYSSGKSEEIVGRAAQGRRNDLVIATKVFNPMGPGPNDRGLSRRHIRQQIGRSLERLKMKYVDLYQTHRWDYETPIEETLSALDDLIHEGTVNYIGASSMWAWQLATALDTSERLGLEKFVSMQDHYNLAYREEEREMIPLCLSRGVGIISWSPLGRGFLSGRYRRGLKPSGRRYESDKYLKERYFRPQDFKVLDALLAVSKEKDVSPVQVALAWLLSKPCVVAPIVGVTKLPQLEELVGAVDVKLTHEEIKLLEEPYRPRAVEGHY
jgi:aryl-alcohol dehydrogenase-like predicted oxidoreductase